MWKSQQASDNKGRPLFTFPGTVPLLYYTNGLCSAVYPLGCRQQYVSCGSKIRFNMTGRCLRPWSVKAGQTSGLHSPDALGDLEGWQGLKSTEDRSFKCNGFHWLNVSPFSLREMSPRCSAALSPATVSGHMEEQSQTHPVCSWKVILFLTCMC